MRQGLGASMLVAAAIYITGFAMGLLAPSHSVVETAVKSVEPIAVLDEWSKFIVIASHNFALMARIIVFSAAYIPGLLILGFNGYILGSLTSLWLSTGRRLSELLLLVAPHGVIEISVFVYAAAVGMRLPLTARRSLWDALADALTAMGKAAALLVAAAFIEVFITPRLAV
ncbi:stage II sporulation protein M [Hyperthermus butylicus]|uniref:Stage II sporulation protein M n=1 Tax=Hyperthermus butylicus (strain DSM 5456 / JCM 9403 / PLM1-5) TaxID=415426 RepID=A2BM83_HYPBU|nr:stage II sporulation protein M [Hyperthermus butylicus]ABM81094.1 hypothetical protein Hbut_1262 [Hyperthermus butylicus DSM 5456]